MELGGGWREGECAGRVVPGLEGRNQHSGSKIKRCSFPEKILTQDNSRTMSMISDLNTCPLSIENGATGTLKRDTNTKEKMKLRFS